jgi:phosphoribosylformylglycinamidine cyclo-ligase
MTAKPLSYKSSGVDIEAANRFVETIKGQVRSTFSRAVLNRAGSFGALFELDGKNYKEPVLVSSTDGVGTKLLIAQAAGIHDTVGIDLVAMNVNDVICTGARPLFFLDYIACGKVRPGVLKDVVKGIARGCRLSGCALIGGETAEMPEMYKPDEYDLAGFAVGVAEKKRIIDGSTIVPGDVLIGLPSSGLHSNGFSLVRKVFSPREQKAMAKELLTPTRIYVDEVGVITAAVAPKAIAHITGGAFYEKLTRVLPKGRCFEIRAGSWPVPLIFQNIQKRGNITDREMFRTFNMGIGLAVVVAAKDLGRLTGALKKKKIRFYEIGSVINHLRKRVLL